MDQMHIKMVIFSRVTYIQQRRHTFQSNKTILGSGFINNSLRMALNTIFMCVLQKGRLFLIKKDRLLTFYNGLVTYMLLLESYSAVCYFIIHQQSLWVSDCPVLLCISSHYQLYATNCFRYATHVRLLLLFIFRLNMRYHLEAYRLTFDVGDLIYSLFLMFNVNVSMRNYDYLIKQNNNA